MSSIVVIDAVERKIHLPRNWIQYAKYPLQTQKNTFFVVREHIIQKHTSG